MLDKWKERRRLRALLLVALLVVGVAAGTSVALKPAGERTIVEGPLAAGLDFRVTAVAVYAAGMISGNPVLAHVEGTVPGASWYTLPLPGLQDTDHVRVRSGDATVTAFYTDGAALTFSVAEENGTFPAHVTIDYIAGTAWWSHRFELDLDRGTMAMVARVYWGTEALFRDVDLLLVSGEVHTVAPSYGGGGAPAPAAEGAPLGGLFGFGQASTPPSAPGLRTFTIPSSKDAGIYVVHRAERVDLPGAAGKDAKACASAGFSLRAYTSPVNTTEFVVAQFDAAGATGTDTSFSGMPAGLPSYLAVRNAGEVPWIPGVVELWKDAVLVGSDNLVYTPVGGGALIQTGTSFDVTVGRTTDEVNGTLFVNYTLRNMDAIPHRVQISDTRQYVNATLAPPFAMVDGAVSASVTLAPEQEVTYGFAAKA